MEGVPQESPEAFLFRHLRDRNPSMIVLELSTRWQSWVDANFCFLLIKISIEFTLWQEKIKTHDLCFTVIFCIILSMDELYFPKPPSPLTGFSKHYFVRLREACCSTGVAYPSLLSHPNTRTLIFMGSLKNKNVSCDLEV